jgi:putative methyltransferase
VTVEELRHKVGNERGRDGPGMEQPRWVRVNTASTSLTEQLGTTFNGYTTGSLREVRIAKAKEKILHIDEHVPDLLALPPGVELTRTQAYNTGEIVLQDKASCLPAYLLLGSIQDGFPLGNVIDACAAPGNKTTHLAALLSPSSSHTLAATITSRPTIYAVERDLKRSKTLKDTVSRTNTSNAITVLPGQDFLALDPNDARFANVTAILLDPSCSGSGIVGREGVPALSLPSDSRKLNPSSDKTTNHPAKSKKRKRPSSDVPKALSNSPPNAPTSGPQEADTEAEAVPEPAPNPSRLLSLSNLQTHLLTHAFSFPAATHITYSTCSLHHVENENVAARALASKVARERGWRVLKREEQVEGLSNWPCRGVKKPDEGAKGEMELDEVERKACLRCWPDGHANTGGNGKGDGDGGTEGTMGFFVVGFVRNGKLAVDLNGGGDGDTSSHGADDDEEWEGFVD